MHIVRNFAAAAVVALPALLSHAPAMAQDGVYRPQPSQLEMECRNSRRLEICLQYHNLFCSQGIPAACRLAQVGNACTGGDQSACNYYAQLVNIGLDCETMGNQQACAWIQQQGF